MIIGSHISLTVIQKLSSQGPGSAAAKAMARQATPTVVQLTSKMSSRNLRSKYPGSKLPLGSALSFAQSWIPDSHYRALGNDHMLFEIYISTLIKALKSFMYLLYSFFFLTYPDNTGSSRGMTTLTNESSEGSRGSTVIQNAKREGSRGLYLLTSLLLLLSGILHASPSAQLRTFADDLYKEEDYYRAITEYKRFLHTAPNHADRNAVQMSIGMSYLMGKKWNAALPYFQKISVDSNNPLSDEAQFLIAQTHYLANQHKGALSEWDLFQHRFPKNRHYSYATYQKSWAAFKKEDIHTAQKLLKSIEGPLYSKASELSAALENWEGLPHRSPTLAGVMSAVIPGSGQWYAGRFWDGASALAINGLFIAGIYYTFKNEHYFAGGVLTLIGSGFYGGNIFSAVSSAHTFNKQVKESTWKQLETPYGLKVLWTGNEITFLF